MANKIRIHVKFGETKVLVPCGDGGITISDMVDKAIGKYKKAQKLNENDRIVVGRLYQEDGCLLDLDDDVCDIFDDKDTAILEYQFYPHDAGPDYVPPTIGGTGQQAPFDPPPTSITTTLPDSYPPPAPSKPHLATPSSTTDHKKEPSTECNTPPTLSRAIKSSSSLGSHQSDSGYHQTMHSGGSTQGSNRCPTPDNLRSTLQYDRYDYEWPHDTTNDDPHSKMGEFDEDDHTVPRHGGTLSQEDPVSSTGQFTSSGLDQPSHPVASQVSVHSFEGASQPSMGNSQRFSHSPPVNYEMSMPVSQGSFQDPNSSQPSSSGHHGGLVDNLQPSKGGNLHSPNIGNSSFHFSPSMDKLNDFHSGGGGGNRQDNLGNSPFRTNSFHHPQAALSQELPPTSYNNIPGSHPPHDNYSMQPPTDPYNMMVMSQPHGGAWPFNPNMYSNMGGYPQRGGGPPFRNQFNRPDFGMRETDRSSVSSSTYSDYEFNSHYPPPNMYPQFMDKDKKRKISQQDPSDGRGGGRGMPPHHVPPYADMYGYQRQFYHGPDDESSIEVALSQPASYMMYPPHNPYNRYPGFQSQMGPGGPPQPGMGMGMNRMGSSGGGTGGRLKNVPSGYSLSQGVERTRNMGGLGNEKMFGKPRKSTLKNGDKKRSESASKDKYSIDEEVTLTDEEDDDDMKPSPFQRSARKSMHIDDDSLWEKWQTKMKGMNIDDDEYYEDHTNSNPSEDEEEKKTEEDEEPSDLGNIHIVELLRGEEPLGIQLVSYTSKGRDLGVFIGELDSNGFAAKSRELQLFDRILACNGEDFTGESNKNVEERLRAMITKEPLLRMAVSRGLNLDLDEPTNQVEPNDTKTQTTNSRPNSTPGSSDLSSASKPTTTSSSNTDNDTVPSESTSATTPNLVSTSITNTRQLGVKKRIEIRRSEKGTFGFGLASRDVATNDEIPIYVKSISSGGPAFKDGRLKIGDRILEVNGTSVQGMCQADVLNLLRSSKDILELTISRQQLASDPQDEYSDLSQPTSTDQSPLPSTIGKNVFVIDIPLDDCGLQGLGVTVYGRCSKKREDVGVYIKAIQPGGAAAKEGSLRVNDRLLAINNQSLLNMSNQLALDGLKKSLQQVSVESNPVLHVTVARTAGINRKLSLSMSSFSNQMPALHEEENNDNNRTEIGIDCPPDLGVMSQEVDHDNGTPYDEDDYNFTSQTSTGSQISYGKSQEVLDLSVGSFPGSQHPFSNSSKLDYEATSNRVAKSSSSPSTRRGSNQSKDIKGTRLESHEYSSSERGMKQALSSRASLPTLTVENGKYPSSRHTASVSPTSDKLRWSLGGDSQTSSSQSRGSSHSPTNTLTRPSSMHSETSDRQSRHNPTHSQSTSSTRTMTYGHARVNSGSFRRQVSPPYDTLERSPTKERKQYDSDVPQRQQVGSSHTLPKHGSSNNSNYSGRMSPGMEEVTSLYSYSSDPELSANNPFSRTDVNRISIPKKKSSQQPNLSHLKLSNAVPRLEGEGPPSPPLYRTGSDGDLSVHNMHPLPKEMFTNVEVGPSLRMAKSSSLESLQTVMHYTIRSDVRNGDGNVARGKEARNSFRRAVDRSYSGDPLPSSAVISITKSPQKRKESKKNIFSKFFKKTKNSKKDKNRRSRPDSCVDFDSLGDIAKHYGISEKTILRMQSHSGKIEGDDDMTDEEEDDNDYDDDGELDGSHDMYPSQNYRAL